MKRISYPLAALLGAFTALVVAALAYLGSRWAGLLFVPFDLFDWEARILPGPFLTASIDIMVRIIHSLNLGPTSTTAKLGEQSIAIFQFLLIGGVFGLALVAAVGRKATWSKLSRTGQIGGVVLLILVLAIEIALDASLARLGIEKWLLNLLWIGILLLGWGAVLGRLIWETAPSAPQLEEAVESASAEPAGAPGLENGLSRRQFLYVVGGGSAAVLVTALGASLLDRQGEIVPATGDSDLMALLSSHPTSGPAASPSPAALAGRFAPAPGTRPELTSNANFYRIDINTIPPKINATTWRLEVKGLVDHSLSLSLDDLRSRPAVSQVATYECISNTLGGDLISNALWTGVRLKDIMNLAGLQPEVVEIAVKAADGFYESIPLEEAMDERTLLIYEMNGMPLPVEHGFPLRVFIPNHYGMKQPKWITSLEASGTHTTGYWVDRGWSKTAIPKTTSIIDSIAWETAAPNSHTVPVGGIAYAGARGISKVEVQVDNGAWEPAELRNQPLSPLSWVQWRYLWESTPGSHVLRVRAYDGQGVLQETKLADTYPDGATGIDEQRATLP